MDLQEEIAKVARELYEKSGCIQGRDRENWLDAEKIVLARHAGQDMEEPEGEEAIVEEESILEEVEGTRPQRPVQEKEEGEQTALSDEIEVEEPFVGRKKESGTAETAKKIMPAKKSGAGKKTAAPKRERSKKKT